MQSHFQKLRIGVKVRYNGKVIMKESKSTTNVLWYVPIKQNIEVIPKQTTEQSEQGLNLVQTQDLYGCTPVFAVGPARPHCSQQLVQS